MKKVLILEGSSRANGNTDLLTSYVVEGISHQKIHLKDYSISSIRDQRHDEGGFTTVDDDYEFIIKEVLNHDFIIFSTPIYWYGMSGNMKNFVDRWSQTLRDKQVNFKEEMGKKEASVVLCGGDKPRVKGLPLIQQFQYIFDFVNMPFNGYVIGKAGKPGEILNDNQSIDDAKTYNKVLKTHLL